MVNFTKIQVSAAIQKGMDEFDRLYRENIRNLGDLNLATSMKYVVLVFAGLRMDCRDAIDGKKADTIPDIIDRVIEETSKLDREMQPLFIQAMLKIQEELKIGGFQGRGSER